MSSNSPRGNRRRGGLDRRRFRDVGVAGNCGVLRLWRSRSMMCAISSWVRAVSVGGESIPVSIASNMAPIWQGVERRRGLPHCVHVTRTARQFTRRPETRAGAFLGVESPTGTQRLTARQQKPIGQGIGQRQAAPSSVVREGRAAHPQTASAQRVQLCGRGVFEVLLGALQHRRRYRERAVQGAEEITGAGEPVDDLSGRRGCRWQRGQLHFQRRHQALPG